MFQEGGDIKCISCGARVDRLDYNIVSRYEGPADHYMCIQWVHEVQAFNSIVVTLLT